MKAFLIEAHHADLGAGESVNCNGGKEEDNDIHIALGSKAESQECESVSAEIAPHYRPASWNEIGHFETYNSSTRKYIPNPALASRLQAHPYRITGQLFFDASHAPCPCSKACNPIRASVWEIHPVMKMAVGAADSPSTAATSSAPKVSFPSPTPAPAAAVTSASAQFVTLTKPVSVQIPYGATVLQPGTKLQVLSRDVQTVDVRYLDARYTIPISSTDLR